MSSSVVDCDRSVREIVLRPIRPDHAIGPELHLHLAAVMDAEPVQVRLRELLAGVCRRAHYPPYSHDVGHLPTHPGNYRYHLGVTFVRSDHEPVFLVRVALLRGVRTDDDGADARPPQRQQRTAHLD